MQASSPQRGRLRGLQRGLGQLTLNDASLFGLRRRTRWALVFDVVSWDAPHGIIQERLEREYDLDLITTAPTVIYEVLKKSGDVVSVDNPSKLPDPRD